MQFFFCPNEITFFFSNPSIVLLYDRTRMINYGFASAGGGGGGGGGLNSTQTGVQCSAQAQNLDPTGSKNF